MNASHVLFSLHIKNVSMHSRGSRVVRRSFKGIMFEEQKPPEGCHLLRNEFIRGFKKNLDTHLFYTKKCQEVIYRVVISTDFT